MLYRDTLTGYLYDVPNVLPVSRNLMYQGFDDSLGSLWSALKSIVTAPVRAVANVVSSVAKPVVRAAGSLISPVASAVLGPTAGLVSSLLPQPSVPVATPSASFAPLGPLATGLISNFLQQLPASTSATGWPVQAASPYAAQLPLPYSSYPAPLPWMPAGIPSGMPPGLAPGIPPWIAQPIGPEFFPYQHGRRYRGAY